MAQSKDRLWQSIGSCGVIRLIQVDLTPFHKINRKKDMKYKKKLLTILIISMAALLISSCTRTGAASSWPGYSVEGETGYLSYAAQTYAINLVNGSLEWKFPSEADRGRQAYSAPLVENGLAVFGDYNGVLVAVDAENGTKKWEFTGADDRYIASAGLGGQMIYAPNSDGTIYALDEEGNLAWKFVTGGPNWSQPVSDDEFVYIASMNHNIYAFSQDFEKSLLELAKDGSKTLRTDAAWSTDLGMAIVADPVLEDGVLYTATIEGAVYALDAATGAVMWSFKDAGNLGAVWGAPVVDGDVVFVADIDGNVYTIEKESGKQNWPSAFSAGGRIVGSGALTDDGVVFATDEGKVFLINREKEPKTLSSFENPINSSIEVYDGNILIAPASEEGLLTAIGTEGFEIWSFIPAD